MTKLVNKALTLKKTSGQLSNLIGEYKSEIRKIKWVTKKEVWAKAKLVIVTSFIMGFLTYAADLVIKGALDLCHMLFKWAF